MVWISRIHADSCRASSFHRLTCDNRSPRRSRERCPTAPGAGHEEPVFPWSRANFRHHVLRLVRKNVPEIMEDLHTDRRPRAIQTRFGVTATQAPRGGRVGGPGVGRFHASREQRGPMRLALALTSAQADRLRKEADRLGIAPAVLARATLEDLCDLPDAGFPRRR